MKIADLFVELGITNAGKVKGELQGIQGSLQKTGDAAFAAKAGILGALLGLEELTRRSVGAAVDLRMFAGATGESTAALQRWQYVATMNHVSAEELAGTIRGLQSAQADMALGKGIPAGALWFGIDMTKRPVEMFDQIAKKLRAIGNDTRQIGIARSMASSLGISDNMFAMLRTGNLSLAAYRRELELTTRDIDKLTQVDRAWNQFWFDLSAASKKVVAEDLAEPVVGAVQILDDAVREFGDLVKKVEAMGKQAGKLPGAPTKPVPGTGWGMLAGGGALAAGVAMGSNPIGWLGALLLGASVLADVRRGGQGKPSIAGEAAQHWKGLSLLQILSGGSMEDRRRVQGAGPNDDLRTGLEKLIDWFSSAEGAHAGQGMNPFAAIAGAAGGAPVTNNVTINLQGVRDPAVPQRAATEVVRAINNLPGKGR